MIRKLTIFLLALALLCASLQAFGETISLTVAGTAVNEDLLREYAKLHPHIEFKFIGQIESRKLVEDAITHDDSVDIYFFHTLLSTAYQQLRDRGYMQAITNPNLLQTIRSFYPEIADGCTADSSICALPFGVVIQSAIGISENVWIELGLEKARIPRTWEDFLTFIVSAWPAISKAHPEISLFDGGDQRELLQLVMNNFEDYRTSSEEMPSYRSEVLLNLLNLFSQMDPSAFDAMGEQSLFSMYYYPDVTNKGERRLLPLSFIEGENPCLGFAMYVAAINPNTKNLGAAQDLLQYIADHMDAYDKLSLCPDNNAPILSDNYDQMQHDYNAAVQEYAERIASARDSERTLLEQELSIYKQQMNDYFDKYKYAASEESIARYRAEVRDRLVPIYAPSISSEERAALYDKQMQFLDHHISAEQYALELERRFEFSSKENAD